jgi:uncharacterized tellurite resistance protein B-like protein
MPNREDVVDSLSDLDPVEANAFAILVRTVVRADGGVSAAERQGLASIASEMGEERFWKFMDRAEAVHGKEAVERAASRVERTSVRTLIFVTLSDLAISETIVETEAAVLDWLADLWQLQIRTLEEPSGS